MRVIRWTIVGLIAVAATNEARAQSNGISTVLAIGVAGQSDDERALLGVVFRVGVGARLVPRLDWEADLTIERFGHRHHVHAPCNPDFPCPEGVDAVTLGHGTAVVVLREEGGPHAYLLAGGGVTRLIADPAPSRTYAHATGGIGWKFAQDDFAPFLELRFNKYVRARDPMPSWTLPVVVGVRF